MPRAFLVKPRPFEQVPVTSESSHDVHQTSSVGASPWLQIDHDVNNNTVAGRSSMSSRPSCVDLAAVRPADEVARWPLDVAGGFRWWSMLASRSAAVGAQSSTMSWSDARRGPAHDVTPSAELSSPAAAAAELETAADDVAQHLWWSSSPHSDVSASGLKPLVMFTPWFGPKVAPS